MMSLRTKPCRLQYINSDIEKSRNGIFKRVSVGRVLFTLCILALCLVSVAYQVNFGTVRVGSKKGKQISEGRNLGNRAGLGSALGSHALPVTSPAREFEESHAEQTGDRGVLSTLTEIDSGFEPLTYDKTPGLNTSAELGSKSIAPQPTVEPWPMFFYMTRVKPCISLLLNITARFNPDSTIYLLTDQETPPEDRVLEQLKQLRVRVMYYNPNPEPGSNIDIFRRHYKHRSINGEWYEKMCFERFFILEKFALQEGVKRFYYFDADTALFEDLRNTPYVRFHDRDFVGLTHLSSYNALWRIDVLREFCKFMLWFYQRPIDVFDRDVELYGGYVYPNGKKTVQFSDMYLVAAFLQLHKFSRILLLYEIEIPLRARLKAIDHPNALRSPEDHGQICESVEHFDRYLDWRMTDRGLLAPYQNGTLLTGLQFEGPCKKAVMPHVLLKIFPGTPEDDLQWL